MPATVERRQHLTATLILCCLAQFMVILDVSVVNVALPAIHRALGFSESALQWVVNAYTVTFAGFLLLGGRATDLIGRRIVFVCGLVLFALASLAGGLATSQTMLVVARLVQGLGGAVIAPASLSILTTTFTEPAARNRAVGIWGAMGGAGGAAGVILGGVLTQALSWRWILFINVPIGLTAALLTQAIVAEGKGRERAAGFDLMGAVSATAGLSLLVLGIVRTDTTSWGDASTLALIGGGVALLGLFVLHEGRIARWPLMPLGIYRSRTLSAANLTVMLVGAASFGMWFFLTLYLQQVLGYSALGAGLAFLPMTLSIVAGSTIASRVVRRTGARPLLVGGMLALAAGLWLFHGLPTHGAYVANILAGSLLCALGIAFAFVTGTIAAVSGVPSERAGLASGLVNTSRMFGGALGLAVLATIAAARTRADLHHLAAASAGAHAAALTSGFGLAFGVGAGIALVAALIAAIGLPRRRPAATRPAAVPEPQL